MHRISLLPLALAPALLLGSAEAAAFTVGLAFDLGGRNDQGFNQAAFQGAKRAIDETGGEVQVFEPQKLADVGSGIPRLASMGSKIVIGVGFSNNAAITQAAASNPGARFVTVDDLPKGPNTVGLRFREQEGSFLAGYLAGKQSATGQIGFVGGVDLPVIRRFRAGFQAGVKFACPACQVKSVYVSTTSQGFNNPAVAKQLAAKLLAGGTDIIYTAAGASGLGVIEQIKAQPCLKAANLPAGVKFAPDNFAQVPRSAAEQKACAGDSRPTFFIGVDVNQNALGDFDKNPATLNHGLTSMLKRVDNAVYAIVKDVAEGRPWRSGDRSFGLSNGGIALAVDQYNKALIPAPMQANLKKIEDLIVNGTLKVPTQ
ncbi:basic membrane lipoprotein [Deinococcus phoenicis]|uniref:Basic membrane lipoprotein n=1 Tax=Deinococcus phoenicis TaxID=1476583 RepID=A0A016QP30_9DEIO|nr:BMP family ABC transporter substrate-binding protein [Deinococcus phoenicis]EYB67751.1 basic membrane lipoprotein [Deinococcus phoenicis]